MARYSKSFQMTLNTMLDARVRAAYKNIEGHAACAGIFDNEDAAYKARRNHHGFWVKSNNGPVWVPARRFVDVSNRATEFPEYKNALRDLIKSNFKAATIRQMRYDVSETSYGAVEKRTVDVRGTQPFGTPGVGPARLMKMISEQLAAAQRDVISSKKLPPNKPSTKARKKSDTPLIDTKEMYSAIQAKVKELE